MPTSTPESAAEAPTAEGDSEPCCPLYHRSIEMVGRRWTGAIIMVLMPRPLRFSEIGATVPDVSDRLLSERLKELEAEGIVERHVLGGSPVGVEYALTQKGRALKPAIEALKTWAQAWQS